MTLLPFHPALSFPALRSDAGVINASTALLGMLTITAVGGVAVTSLDGVIDAAQDAAARQNASQLGTAEGLARIMDGAFTDTAGLEAGGYLPAYREASGPRRFTALAPADGTCFVVVSRSATGALYFVTDKIPHPEALAPGTDTGCVPGAAVRDAAHALDLAAAEAAGDPATDLPAGEPLPGLPAIPEG